MKFRILFLIFLIGCDETPATISQRLNNAFPKDKTECLAYPERAALLGSEECRKGE